MVRGDRKGSHEVTGVEIRAMREEDAGAIAGLDANCFSQGWSAGDHAGYAADPNVIALVACNYACADDGAMTDAGTDSTPSDEGEDVRGYVLVQRAADEGDVLRVAVRPEMRGCGIGGALVQEALRCARERGVTRLFLEVRSSNEAAIRMYRRCGFEQIGTRKHYYRDPVEDALLMRWRDSAGTDGDTEKSGSEQNNTQEGQR